MEDRTLELGGQHPVEDEAGEQVRPAEEKGLAQDPPFSLEPGSQITSSG